MNGAPTGRRRGLGPETLETMAPPLRYAILLFPGFPMMAFSAVVEPLRAANLIAGRQRFAWSVVGLSGQPIKASIGVSIPPHAAVADDPPADRVVVISGGDADRLVSEPAVRWIRRRLRAGAELGAVADASFFLARAGLLDGYQCTLHWSSRPAFAEAFARVALMPDLFVLDRDRFTAVGGVGCFDMMLALIERDLGAEAAAGVAEWFAHSPLRDSVDRRLMPLRLRTGIRDALVLSAVAIMEEALEDRLSVADVAARLSVSPDRLERAFRAELGAAPGEHYRRLRLRRAHELLRHSRMPVAEIALSCGFANPSSFARAFKGAYGVAPSSLRNDD